MRNIFRIIKSRKLVAVLVVAAMFFTSSIALADATLLTTDENLIDVYAGNDNGVADFLGKFDDNENWDGNPIDGIGNINIQNDGKDASFDVTKDIEIAQLSVKGGNQYALYNIPGGQLLIGTYLVTSWHLLNNGGNQPAISHVSFFGSGDVIEPEDPGEDPGEDPEDPGEDPEDPGEDPEDPGEDPEDPGEDPEDPGEDPEDPGEDPEDPGDDPEDPGDDPEDPAIPLGSGTGVTQAIPLGIPQTGDVNLNGIVVILGSMLLAGGAILMNRQKKED